MANSIIGKEAIHLPDERKPITLSKKEREKAMERCGYECGLKKGEALKIARGKMIYDVALSARQSYYPFVSTHITALEGTQ
jgi:hypothetical protein